MSNDQKGAVCEVKHFEKRLLNVEEAAAYLGLSRRTLYNGVGPKSKTPFPVRAKRIGTRVLFDRQDLDRYIDSLA
jgi:predicted DNA-binding transcriptional regulator AlpA